MSFSKLVPEMLPFFLSFFFVTCQSFSDDINKPINGNAADELSKNPQLSSIKPLVEINPSYLNYLGLLNDGEKYPDTISSNIRNDVVFETNVTLGADLDASVNVVTIGLCIAAVVVVIAIIVILSFIWDRCIMPNFHPQVGTEY